MYLGVHLGQHRLSAAVVDRRGVVREMWELEPPSGDRGWRYTAGEMETLLQDMGERIPRKTTRMVLSVPAWAVVIRQVEAGARVKLDREALMYAAEPWLPWPIDELHLLPVGGGEQPLVMAMPQQPWTALLQQIDAAGWVCTHAFCDAVGLWRDLVARRPDCASAELFATVARHDGAIVVTEHKALKHVRPFRRLGIGEDAWSHSQLEQELQRTWFAVRGTSRCAEGVLICEQGAICNDATADGLTRLAVADLLPDASVKSLGVLYAAAAARVLIPGLGSEKTGDFNLRRDGWRSALVRTQHRRVGIAHAACLALGLVMVAAGFWQHGQRLSADAEHCRAVCRHIWAELFPETPPPIDVQARLVSEHERETALRGEGQQVPRYDPALAVLRDVMAALPAKVPLKVAQLDVSDRVSVIAGQARSHGEVEQVAAHVARIPGVTVHPATTERTGEGTVRFTLRFERDTHEQG